MHFHTFLPLLLLSTFHEIPLVFAWGAAGHEIVATIAQIHLHPSVFSSICHILNYTSHDPTTPLCHLAPVATWADKVRFKMPWSRPLHFINSLDDWPRQNCAFPGERGWDGTPNGNVIAAIKNTTGILRDWVKGREDDDMANEALKFLVHFVGDMHQPLHLAGRQRGGNEIQVTFDKKHTNFHSAWDTSIIAKAIRTVPRNYTHPLPSPFIEHALRGTIYDAYVRRIMWEGVLGKWKNELRDWLSCPDNSAEPAFAAAAWQRVLSLFQTRNEEWDDAYVCPFAWAKPIHQLNCDVVWPKAFDNLGPEPPVSAAAAKEPLFEVDTPEYLGALEKAWFVEKLLAQAGIRLAAVLNHLFEAGHRS